MGVGLSYQRESDFECDDSECLQWELIKKKKKENV